MTTATLPVTVEIPAEALIDSVAMLLDWADEWIEFSGGNDTPMSTQMQDVAGRLLSAVAPSDPPRKTDIDWKHPIVVEAYARTTPFPRANLVREKQDARYRWELYNGEES